MKRLITHQNGIKIILSKKHLNKRCIKKSKLNLTYPTKAEHEHTRTHTHTQLPLTPLQESFMFGRKWNQHQEERIQLP